MLSNLIRSQVIEQMQNNATPDTCSVAFFYCARGTPETGRDKCAKIMGALLKQLASSDLKQLVREPIAKEYEDRKKIAQRDCSELRALTTEDCVNLTLDLTCDNQATIIVDAVDECDDDERHELLKALDRIIKESEGLVKVFLSSRETILIVSSPIHYYFHHFLTWLFVKQEHMTYSPVTKVSTSGNTLDIERFIEAEVNRLCEDKLLLRGRMSPRLKKKTIKKLNIGAQGMFRWVVLSLETLRKINYDKDFEKELGKLPPMLSGLYDIIFTQIDEARTHERDVATKMLKWLLCAQRLMSIGEFIFAISGDFELEAGSSSDSAVDSSSDSDEGSTIEEKSSPEDGPESEYSLQEFDIVQFCRSLVTVDSEQNTFRFAHQSVREYLLTKEDYSLLNAHSLALERCLYENTINAAAVPEQGPILRRNSEFQQYATLFWPLHDASEVLGWACKSAACVGDGPSEVVCLHSRSLS
jgi:hypothetical protein